MLTFLISWLCVYRLLSILQYHRLLEPVLDYLVLPFYLKVDLVIVEPASCQGRREGGCPLSVYNCLDWHWQVTPRYPQGFDKDTLVGRSLCLFLVLSVHHGQVHSHFTSSLCSPLRRINTPTTLKSKCRRPTAFPSDKA